MYKNQLQELAQRSCFNLPWYTCVREGPDHAPRFKAVVNFNGETFESPLYCSTLRQAEHSAAESALASLSSRHSLAARILDETGVYKNLLQEIAQRVGAPLPQYTTFRSGSGHLPIFTGIVELAGITFTGDPAKNKKQAEKNAALSAWLSLKQLAQQDASSSSENENNNEEIEQIRISRALQNYRLKAKLAMGANVNSSIPIPFPKKFSGPTPRPSSPQRPSSKILPLFNQKTNASQNRPSLLINNSHTTDVHAINFQKLFSIAGASPYVPIRQCSREPYQGIAPPVTLRPSVPVFSSFPAQPRPIQVAPPVSIKQALPGFSTPTTVKQDQKIFSAPSNKLLPTQPRPIQVAPPVSIRQALPVFSTPTGMKQDEKIFSAPSNKLLPEIDVDESIAVKCLEQLEL